MCLPRPYPDELVGSMLNRASRQLGLSQKRLLPILTGRNITSHSMVITSHGGIARACGMGLEELLLRHTLLPYTTAFMRITERARIWRAFTGSQSESFCAAAISQNSTKATNWMNLCPECIRVDFAIYGEAYWHRSHQLPGVTLCLPHQLRLQVTDVPIRRAALVPLPHEAHGLKNPERIELPLEVQTHMTELSVAALNGELQANTDWSAGYQAKATSLGYALTGGNIYGESLAQDMHRFYGRTYLQSVDGDFEPMRINCWPKLMFRSSGQNPTAFRHVLMNVFLDSEPKPSKLPEEAHHGPKPRQRDWSSIEREALCKMKKVVARHKATGTRVMLKDLFVAAEVKIVMHHHRAEVPRLVAWIDSFKTTPQAERQAGKRPRTYPKKG